MREFIEFIAKHLVDDPDRVKVTEEQGEKGVIYKLTVGENDGDEIYAIQYIGNFLLAVIKRNHTYIINMSSVSESNWALAKTFDIGTEKPDTVKNTEYGLCFTNNKGVWLITPDLQLVELSTTLDWSTHWVI